MDLQYDSVLKKYTALGGPVISFHLVGDYRVHESDAVC